MAAEVSLPTGPAAIATSAPSLKLFPPVNALRPSSFVITNTRPTDCAPIWIPIDAPERPMKEGPFHVPLGFLRRTRPSPTCPPIISPAFVTAGKIATPFPDLMTSAMLSASPWAAISRTSSAESLILLSCAFSSANAVSPVEKITTAAKIRINARDFEVLFMYIPPVRLVFQICT